MPRRPPLRTSLALVAAGSAVAVVAVLLPGGDAPAPVALGVAASPVMAPEGFPATPLPSPAAPLPTSAAPAVTPPTAATRSRVPARTAPAAKAPAPTLAPRPRTTTAPAPAATTAPRPRRTTTAPDPAPAKPPTKPTPPPTPPPTTRAPVAGGSAYTSRLLALVNAARADRGLRRLAVSSCAQGYAQRQAASMARRGVMDHQDLGAVLNACDGTSAGENVAYGRSSADEMFADWMASSGHRANILNPRWTHMGNGASTRSDGRVYGAQVFLTLS